MGYFCFAPRGGLREKWYLDPPSHNGRRARRRSCLSWNIPIFISLPRSDTAAANANVLFCFCTFDTLSFPPLLPTISV